MDPHSSGVHRCSSHSAPVGVACRSSSSQSARVGAPRFPLSASPFLPLHRLCAFRCALFSLALVLGSPYSVSSAACQSTLVRRRCPPVPPLPLPSSARAASHELSNLPVFAIVSCACLLSTCVTVRIIAFAASVGVASVGRALPLWAGLIASLLSLFSHSPLFLSTFCPCSLSPWPSALVSVYAQSSSS